MKKTIATLLLSLSLTSCIVYKIDVQQGNVVTQEMLAQVEPGMTKREVKSRLGTPLVVDPFHANRWDYYYSIKEGRRQKKRRQSVTLLFDGDILQSIEEQLDEEVDKPE
ncbi:MAG: outer membrane protein assembly factor BamE [Pseudomonadota bacterium]|nr:outer membrane protein assembly factor BamE [Pseudomonadota bacterium]